jgi:hypothetical protein
MNGGSGTGHIVAENISVERPHLLLSTVKPQASRSRWEQKKEKERKKIE